MYQIDLELLNLSIMWIQINSQALVWRLKKKDNLNFVNLQIDIRFCILHMTLFIFNASLYVIHGKLQFHFIFFAFEP